MQSAASSQPNKSLGSQTKAESPSPQTTGAAQVDTPSRPPEQQPSRNSASTASVSTSAAAAVASTSTASSDALRLAEDLRDARIELDEVRRTRERVVDEFKEFRHRYQETLHALEREKAQMERLVAVTEEWFGKAEKMAERREVKLTEDQAICAKRIQEEEEKEKAESAERARLALEEEKRRLEEEERARVDAERAAAEDREKARLLAVQKQQAEEEKARIEAEDRARVDAAEKARIEAENKARAEALEKARIEAEKQQQRANRTEIADRPHETMDQEHPRTPPPRTDRAAYTLVDEQSTENHTASISGIAQTTSPRLTSVAGGLGPAFQPAQTSERQSAYVPLSLGLPSIEVRQISPRATLPVSRDQSNVSQPRAPITTSNNSLAGSASPAVAKTPQRTPDLNKEEQLKAQLLQKKVATPDSTCSKQPSATVTPTAHASSTAGLVDTARTLVAPATSIAAAQATNKNTSPAPRALATPAPPVNGKGPARPHAPAAASTQSHKTGKAARKRGGGPTVMVKPEPSPSPPILSPVVPLRPQALPVVAPAPVSSAPASTRPPVPAAKSTHALPQKPTTGPPPPKNANPTPASQAQARVRVSSGGDRSVRALVTPAGDVATYAPPPASQRSVAQGSQAETPRDRPANTTPLTTRLGYVPNYHNLPLDEDEPWNVAIRDTFGPTDDHSGALLEERSRRSRDNWSPSPVRQSSRGRSGRHSPISSPRSPRRDSYSPMRKRMREDDRERDFSPPPPRRARYSESSNDASPRQRRDSLSGTRGRDYDRAVTPPYPYDYRSPPPNPMPARIEADTYRPYSHTAGRRSPPPPSRAPAPPREPIRQRPARSPVVDDYRRAAPLSNRITGLHRPATPSPPRSPSPQPLVRRMAVPAHQEQNNRDPAPVDLLSRMTDAPAFAPRPSGGKPKLNRGEAPPRRGRNDGKRFEGKRPRTETHAVKEPPPRPSAESKKPLALRFTS